MTQRISKPRWLCEWRDLLALDLRSLALFRVAIGTTMLCDLYVRWQDIEAFYTDVGVLPRDILLTEFMRGERAWYWSVYHSAGTVGQVQLLFILHGAIVLLFLLGWRTRTMTVLAWIFLVSIQNRNYVILNGGDTVMRMVMFWSMFLPLGARFSIDHAMSLLTGSKVCVADRGNLHPPGNKDSGACVVEPSNSASLQLTSSRDRYAHRLVSMATLAFIIQVFLIYFSTGLQKTEAEWLNGTALHISLGNIIYARPLALWVRETVPFLLAPATYAAKYMEIYGIFLLVMPIYLGACRLFSVVFWVGFHVMLFLLMGLGFFPMVCIAMWLALLPGGFWSRICGLLQRRSVPAVTFELSTPDPWGERLVRLGATFLLPQNATIHVHPGTDSTRSWCMVDADGRRVYGVEATLAYLRQSLWAWPLSYLLRLPGVNATFRAVSWLICRRSMPPSTITSLFPLGPVPLRSTWPARILCLLSLIYVCAYCSRAHTDDDDWFPDSAKPFGYALRLHQTWAMFAPGVSKSDGWFIIFAELSNGNDVNLWRLDEPLDFRQPANNLDMFGNRRWGKYLMRLTYSSYKPHREYFVDYMEFRYRRAHPDSLPIRMTYFVQMQRRYNRKNGEWGEPTLRTRRWVRHSLDPED